VASKILPRQLFLRVSALLQVLTFCLFLSVYVLEPSLEARAALVAPQNQTLLASLPSYWFLGLFQQLNGSMEPAFLPLARRAWIALAISVLGTVASILLSYLHTMRRIVEEPDILPSSRRFHGPLRITNSLDNAVLLFSLRTLLRSRQHRLILSLYLGVGFAVMLILVGPALGNRAESAGAFLTVSILMLCVAVLGVRTVFSMPIMLRANWLFRVAALQPVARYSKAVRRSFLLLAVAPVWAAFAALFLSIWPWRVAAAYLVALGLAGSILADLCSHGFHKIPFTCSYQPGKANVQFAFWGFLVSLPLTRMAANHVWKTLQHPGGRAVIIVSLFALAIAARWRTSRAAQLADAMQFEEVDEPQIVSLELSTDGVLLRNSL
jgi:hypothetical protein